MVEDTQHILLQNNPILQHSLHKESEEIDLIQKLVTLPKKI
jgi:hypothetical protein